MSPEFRLEQSSPITMVNWFCYTAFRNTVIHEMRQDFPVTKDYIICILIHIFIVLKKLTKYFLACVSSGVSAKKGKCPLT